MLEHQDKIINQQNGQTCDWNMFEKLETETQFEFHDLIVFTRSSTSYNYFKVEIRLSSGMSKSNGQ